MSATQDLMSAHTKSVPRTTHPSSMQNITATVEKEETKCDTSVAVQTSTVPKTRIVELSKCDIMRDVPLDTYLLFGLDRNIISLASLIKYHETYREEFGLENLDSTKNTERQILDEEEKEREELHTDLQQVILYIIYYLSLYKDKLNHINKDAIDKLEKKKLSGETLDNMEKSIWNLAYTDDYVPLEVVYDYIDSLCICTCIAKKVEENMDKKMLLEELSIGSCTYEDFKERLGRQADKIRREQHKQKHKQKHKQNPEQHSTEAESAVVLDENPINDLDLIETLGMVQYHLVRIQYLRRILKETLDDMVESYTPPPMLQTQPVTGQEEQAVVPVEEPDKDAQTGNRKLEKDEEEEKEEEEEEEEEKEKLDTLVDQTSKSQVSEPLRDYEIENHTTLYEDIDTYFELIDDASQDNVLIKKKDEKLFMQIVECVIHDIREKSKKKSDCKPACAVMATSPSDTDSSNEDSHDDNDEEPEDPEEPADTEEEGEEDEVEDECMPLLHRMIRVREDLFTDQELDYVITVVLPTFGCQQLDNIVREYSVKNNLKASHVFKSQ